MNKIKVSSRLDKKIAKIQMDIEIPLTISHDNNLTNEFIAKQVKEVINKQDKAELGELVLNNLKDSIVLVETK
mgnify:CR=1 FL=1